MKRILVVSTHPDDETLGTGGYVLKHKQAGDEIYWLNITDMKEEYGYTKERCDVRAEEIERVKDLFGFNELYNLRLKPAALDTYEKGFLVGKISEVIKEVKPQIVILPNKTDVHSDHGIVFEAAYSCTKAFRYPEIEFVMCMQILSETDYSDSVDGFIPNYYVNIENQLEQKIEIAKIYASEIQNFPFPRSEECIRALAVLHGGSSFCRGAEAFRIVRQIEGEIC